MNLLQTPQSGEYTVYHRGDTVTITLHAKPYVLGSAWLRTNIGRAHVARLEIVERIELGKPVLSHDWHDVEMHEREKGVYSITLPLTQVGRFEAKSYFLPADKDNPIWPSGENLVIKVEPTDYLSSNTIYNAFVRQFGSNMRQAAEPFASRTIKTLENRGYSVIPDSGTFRNLIKELDFIIGDLGFRIIQLLPVFPVPTTYGRMGSFGSPFAALSFTGVDPAYAELDRKTTPVDQFQELADAIHFRNGKLFLDLPINHTGWGSEMQNEHPEWFARDENRSFESPGAWGVTWEDLAKLDYGHKDLWIYMANVFLFWCERGVDGFRCDAGYMVPVAAWEYIVAKVRVQFPDTVFFLEGLGGSLQVTDELLSNANLNWAYSELFQNFDRDKIVDYLTFSQAISAERGLLVHFAETHDNNRLASISQVYSRMRTTLCAMSSQSGGFGIANGVEWFADDKIDVHGAPSLKWGSDENQVEHIRRLNSVMEVHPCFHHGAETTLIAGGSSSVLIERLVSADGQHIVLVIINLDSESEAYAEWHMDEPKQDEATKYRDMLSGRDVAPGVKGGALTLSLNPGEGLCLSLDESWGPVVDDAVTRRFILPEALNRQRLKAKAWEVMSFFKPDADAALIDVEKAANDLAFDHRSFCVAVSVSDFPMLTTWQWPRDSKREVMVPSGFLLYVTSPDPFTLKLRSNGVVMCCESSLTANDGTSFTMICPPTGQSESSEVVSIELSVREKETVRNVEVPLIYLSSEDRFLVKTSFKKTDVLRQGIYAICTNGRGALSQVRGAWGEIRTQYDALLAANMDKDFPVDRTVMLTRCRVWLVSRGFSQLINIDCQKGIVVQSDGSVEWRFAVPAGQGFSVPITIFLSMKQDENAVTIDFKRNIGTPEDVDALDDIIPINLVIRPDVECRFNHEKTKAYAGAEKAWPKRTEYAENGFSFKPTDRHCLRVGMSNSRFTSEPEWQYMIPHPEDSERGLGGNSDLFSPGFFTVSIQGGDNVTLKAKVMPSGGGGGVSAVDDVAVSGVSLKDQLCRAMNQFIVARDDSKTVIAGYPWFLDWGRDTLICLRGIIAADMLDESLDILRQFAFFEENGTLPNMIHGKDASNRDTSDAPLWFFVACSDIHKKLGSSFLDTPLGERTMREVLHSIADNYISGTPNNIRMDQESCLIFSPSHFTWMDTNHPACTPREGYPVEIQALWYAALSFMAEVDSDKRWGEIATKVRASIMRLYPVKSQNGVYVSEYLSDCLHAHPGQPASEARPDDHLRPNQLFAITLGALEDRIMAGKVMSACEELLVPGAIRSLADRDNDSPFPYRGSYQGDEDTSRKPSYHNGTAWTWQFPSFSEAMVMVYGLSSVDAAKSILYSSSEIINKGCVRQIPEIVDGNVPHRQRGCGAQAWGVTELYRVENLLSDVAAI